MFGMTRQMIEKIPQQNRSMNTITAINKRNAAVEVSRNKRTKEQEPKHYFHLKNPDGSPMERRGSHSNTDFLTDKNLPISYQQVYNKMKRNIQHDKKLLQETLDYINGCMQYLIQYPHLGTNRSQDAELLRVKSLEQYEELKSKVQALMRDNFEASKDSKLIYKRHHEIKNEITTEYADAIFGQNSPVEITTPYASSFSSGRLCGFHSPMMQQNNPMNHNNFVTIQERGQLDNQLKDIQMQKNQLEMDRAKFDKEKLIMEDAKYDLDKTFHRCQEIMSAINSIKINNNLHN